MRRMLTALGAGLAIAASAGPAQAAGGSIQATIVESNGLGLHRCLGTGA